MNNIKKVQQNILDILMKKNKLEILEEKLENKNYMLTKCKNIENNDVFELGFHYFENHSSLSFSAIENFYYLKQLFNDVMSETYLENMNKVYDEIKNISEKWNISKKISLDIKAELSGYKTYNNIKGLATNRKELIIPKEMKLGVLKYNDYLNNLKNKESFFIGIPRFQIANGNMDIISYYDIKIKMNKKDIQFTTYPESNDKYDRETFNFNNDFKFKKEYFEKSCREIIITSLANFYNEPLSKYYFYNNEELIDMAKVLEITKY